MREAGVMLLIKDGLILSISRRNDKTKFGLPGGKFDPEREPIPDTNTEDAAIAETREETGVKVYDCIHIFRRDEEPGHPGGEAFHVDCYFATLWDGVPHDSEEGTVAWLTEEELTGEMGAFADYNRRTLAAFREKFPNYLKSIVTQTGE